MINVRLREVVIRRDCREDGADNNIKQREVLGVSKRETFGTGGDSQAHRATVTEGGGSDFR
jgi:hypothetical protein